jgi:hypothetical protein
VVILIALELQREKEHVREVCEGKGKEKVQRRGQGAVERTVDRRRSHSPVVAWRF